MRPAATPKVYTRAGRCSTPGMPPGMAEKSSLPSSLVGWKLKEQWSVPMVSISPFSTPCHRAARSSPARRGGAQTYLAPWKPGREYFSSVRVRYWGQVSRYTFCPRARARRAASSPRRVDRWTTFTGAPACSARASQRVTASSSMTAAWDRGWLAGLRRPAARSWAVAASMRSPFSQWQPTTPPCSATARMTS